LIQGLTFTHFKGTTNVLEIVATNSGTDSEVFEISKCRFTHNTAGVIAYMSGADLRFIDNLVSDSNIVVDPNNGLDVGAFAVTLDADLDAAVTATNNTIIGTRGGPAIRIGTLVTGDSHRISEVSDNILWNNQNSDVVFTGTQQHVYPLIASYNLYNSVSGNVPRDRPICTSIRTSLTPPMKISGLRTTPGNQQGRFPAATGFSVARPGRQPSHRRQPHRHGRLRIVVR
jgi:hypothetical protein